MPRLFIYSLGLLWRRPCASESERDIEREIVRAFARISIIQIEKCMLDKSFAYDDDE